MSLKSVRDWSNQDPANQPLSLRCPGCRHIATFNHFAGAYDVVLPSGTRFGQRYCPNPDCRTHVFVLSHQGEVQASYPAQRIDFDSTDIPEAVVRSLEEAITCHASRCFTAAAIMVRKTLEDICRDRGAEGSTLKERLRSLGTRVVLPMELLEALDDLRLLGNDAAHVEAQTFNEVGQAEVEVGIAVAKEVLKAVYQYSTLLKQLRSLKRM